MGKLTFPSTKTDVLSAPWNTSEKPANIYSPVDCDFTDELEYVAVKKISVTVKYWDKKDSKTESSGFIKDIETANQEEHLIMSNGDRIRLDYIIRVRIND